MTIPGIWAVDKLGRRKTMIYGAFGMAVCQLIVAATGTAIGTGNPAGQKVLVAFVCIYIAHFAAICESSSDDSGRHGTSRLTLVVT